MNPYVRYGVVDGVGLTVWVGRRALMAVREEDLDDRKVISRIDNTSVAIFMDLLEVREKQSEYRRSNMSQKRFKRPIPASQTSTETSLEGTYHASLPRSN